MGFNSAFKGLRTVRPIYRTGVPLPSRCCILYIYIFFFNKFKCWVFSTCCTLSVFLFKMSFISQCYLFWFLYYSHFTYRMC